MNTKQEGQISIEQLEMQLMTALLAGEDDQLAALRRQYQSAVVGVREFTGVGLFTHFVLPGETYSVTPRNFEIGDVFLDLAGVENGASAILFVREGRLDFLEVVTHTDSWPGDLVLQRLYYSPSQRKHGREVRDLDALRRSWYSH